jgi:Fe-S-cluster containining protein
VYDAVERCRRQVAALAGAALRDGATVATLAALLEEVEALVAGELEARPGGVAGAACGPGCAICCTVNVGTLGAEGAIAAEWLRARRTGDQARAAAAALSAFHDRVRWLEDAERISERIACPLLDGERRCTIHAVRPLACRGISSLDEVECRRALGATDDDAPVIRMDLMQHALYGEALSALRERAAEAGLDARCRDVSGMVGAFLGDASLAARWLAGGRLPLE